MESGQVDHYNDGYSAVWHYNVNDFTEKQRMGAVQVPLMFKWMTPLKAVSPHRFYIGFGARLGFNVTGSYEQKASGLEYQYRDSWYYYPDGAYDQFEEFPAFETERNSIKYGLMNVMGALELGFRWKLGKGPVALYTGVYVDAGVNNISPKVSSNPLVFFRGTDKEFGPEMAPRQNGTYDDAGAMNTIFDHSSILEAHSPHYGELSEKVPGEYNVEWKSPTSNYSKKLTTLSAGIVLKLAFGIRRKKPVVPTLPVFVPEPEPEEPQLIAEPETEPAKMEVGDLNIKEIPIEIKRSMMKLSNSLFAFDKFTLSDEVVAELDKVTAWLIDNPELNIAVEGHTDSIGNENYNQRLSESRAKAVMEYFIAHGVNADRLSYVGYGESSPIADNSTEEGRRQNRRVELKIVK